MDWQDLLQDKFDDVERLKGLSPEEKARYFGILIRDHHSDTVPNRVVDEFLKDRKFTDGRI
ncbi:MAG: hypothetical protein WDN03_01670 [Rhizomicrobium sp.]